MMRVLVSFLACIAVCTAAIQISRYADCGSKGGTINYIKVGGCHQPPCQHASPGANYTVYVSFTATVEITQTQTALGLDFFMNHIQFAFPVLPNDICGHGASCPIHPGQTVVYEMDVQVPSFANAIKLVSKWQLKDGHGADILCFVIPIEIVK